jgi:hypothetical protein
VVRLRDRMIPDPQKLADERENIEASMLAGRRNQVVEQFVKELRERASIKKEPGLLDQG